MTMTTQKQIRAAFWEDHPQFKRKGATKQNYYGAHVRVAFCFYLESLHRDGQISDALVNRATL